MPASRVCGSVLFLVWLCVVASRLTACARVCLCGGPREAGRPRNGSYPGEGGVPVTAFSPGRVCVLPIASWRTAPTQIRLSCAPLCHVGKHGTLFDKKTSKRVCRHRTGVRPWVSREERCSSGLPGGSRHNYIAAVLSRLAGSCREDESRARKGRCSPAPTEGSHFAREVARFLRASCLAHQRPASVQ